MVRQLDAAVGTLQGATSAPPLIAGDAESPPAASRTIPHSASPYAGSIRAYFKGNGTNVLKIAPETSIKLGLNDYLRHHIHAETDSVAPWERMLCGGISGAVGQVRYSEWRRQSLRSVLRWQQHDVHVAAVQQPVSRASDPLLANGSKQFSSLQPAHTTTPRFCLPACLGMGPFLHTHTHPNTHTMLYRHVSTRIHAGPCVSPGHCAHAAGCVQQHRVRRHPAHCRQAVAHRGPRSLLQGACTINGACLSLGQLLLSGQLPSCVDGGNTCTAGSSRKQHGKHHGEFTCMFVQQVCQGCM